LAQLLTDLNADQFAVRHKAEDELRKLRELAEPAMRKELANKPTLEARRRIDRLLEQLERRHNAPEWLREERAIQVLESLATPKARRLVESLAQGTTEADLTRAAMQAMERRSKPAPGPPR